MLIKFPNTTPIVSLEQHEEFHSTYPYPASPESGTMHSWDISATPNPISFVGGYEIQNQQKIVHTDYSNYSNWSRTSKSIQINHYLHQTKVHFLKLIMANCSEYKNEYIFIGNPSAKWPSSEWHLPLILMRVQKVTIFDI